MKLGDRFAWPAIVSSLGLVGLVLVVKFCSPDPTSDFIELLAFTAAAVSVVVGVLAIWLSSRFAEQAEGNAKKAEESSQNIKSSLERIEELYRTFYSDTHRMVRDAWATMTDRIWRRDIPHEDAGTPSGGELSAQATEQLALIGEELARLRASTESSEGINSKLDEIKDRLADIPAIHMEVRDSARRAPAAHPIEVRRALIRNLLSRGPMRDEGSMMGGLLHDAYGVNAYNVVEHLVKEGFVQIEVRDELNRMRSDGLLAFDSESIMPKDIIHLSRDVLEREETRISEATE